MGIGYDESLHSKLSDLVEPPNASNFSWNYTIFWQISRSNSGDWVLCWGDGYCREPKNEAAAAVVVPPLVDDLRRLCEEGKVKEAIQMMDEDGVKADADCFNALFKLCGESKSFENAKKVHDFFLQSAYRSSRDLSHKVIEMYGKCGSMTDARRVFDHLVEKNIDSWELMINWYAENGLGDDGLQMFELMREQGLRPNSDTFLAVFAACASADVVEEAFLHFDSMKEEYGFDPQVEHYLGILDVLGKCGHLQDGRERLQRKMGGGGGFWVYWLRD